MEQNRFEVGDLARLKSGGPYLTVSQVDEKDGFVSLIIWSDKRQEFIILDDVNPLALVGNAA